MAYDQQLRDEMEVMTEELLQLLLFLVCGASAHNFNTIGNQWVMQSLSRRSPPLSESFPSA